jgi:methylmalonyl-CoA carboxyltransferase large subunit
VRQGPRRRPGVRLADRRGGGDGRRGAAEIVFRKEIDEADKPEEKRQELIAQYREAFSNPYVAAEHRLVDAVIEPALTRRHVAQALEYLRIKRQPRPHKSTA